MKTRKLYLKMVLGTISILLLSGGCGGAVESGSSTSSTASKSTTKGDYQLWDYLIPSTETTNNYIKTNGVDAQEYQTKFSTKGDRVIETSNYATDEKTIYTKNSKTITVSFFKGEEKNGEYDLKLAANIGDIVTVKPSNCTLAQHYDKFELEGKTFNDVIEIKCGDLPGYYQKGVGEIAQKENITVAGTQEIRILAN